MEKSRNTEIARARLQEDELPLVSVLMPAFNHEQWLEQAIRSIWAQTYENLELIVVDDASSDKTHSTAMRLADESPIPMNVFRNEENLGICGALNKLIESARGEFIMLHADDDVSYPHKVSTLMNVLLSDSSVIGVHSALQKIDIDGQITGQMPHEHVNREFSRQDIPYIIKNLHRLRIVTQSHITRRGVFDLFGGFMNECSHEAIVMLFREAFVGRILYVDEVLTQYRIGAGVSTKKSGSNIEALIAETVKLNNWHLSAANNILVDIKTIKNDCSFTEYIHSHFLIRWQIFKYWRRHQILVRKSILSVLLGLIFLDRLSISYAMKVFFPNAFMFMRKKVRPS